MNMKKLSIILVFGIVIGIHANPIPTQNVQHQEMAQEINDFGESMKRTKDTFKNNPQFLAELKASCEALKERAINLQKECLSTKNDKICNQYLVAEETFRNQAVRLFFIKHGIDINYVLAGMSAMVAIQQGNNPLPNMQQNSASHRFGL